MAQEHFAMSGASTAMPQCFELVQLTARARDCMALPPPMSRPSRMRAAPSARSAFWTSKRTVDTFKLQARPMGAPFKRSKLGSFDNAGLHSSQGNRSINEDFSPSLGLCWYTSTKAVSTGRALAPTLLEVPTPELGFGLPPDASGTRGLEGATDWARGGAGGGAGGLRPRGPGSSAGGGGGTQHPAPRPLATPSLCPGLLRPKLWVPRPWVAAGAERPRAAAVPGPVLLRPSGSGEPKPCRPRMSGTTWRRPRDRDRL